MTNIPQLLFSFRGSIGRAQYAWVALPILILFQTQALLSPLLFRNMSIPPSSFFIAVSIVMMLTQILRFPLLAASVKRLHDLRLSGWLAAPYLAPLAMAAFNILAPILAVTYGDGIESWTASRKVTSVISQAFWIYGLVLAVVLLGAPGRRSGPEAAF